MITCILDNYLSHEECDELIQYYKDNEERLSVKHGMIYPLKFKEGYDKFPELVDRLNKTAKLLGDNQINWMQIVKWPVGAFQLHHIDQSQPDISMSSILYLNDDYEGGETNYEDGTIFKPKKGRLLFFDGKYYEHGVKEVRNNIRYTVATWYKKI